MIIKSLIFLLFGSIGVSNIGFAQKQNDTVAFIGVLKILPADEDYAYQIKFYITDSNTIVGYSITDMGGPAETISKITGTFNPLDTSIHFQEIKINKAKLPFTDSTTCLIEADVKYLIRKISKTMNGTFTAYNKATRQICVSGEIELIDSKNINKPLTKLSKALEKKVKKLAAKKAAKDEKKKKKEKKIEN